MAKQQMQKTKLLELRDYFEKYTDEHHGVGVSDIIAHLTSCGISCERKAIYNDIDALISYGMDIVCQREGKSTKYFLASRTFETPELKMLVDAVSSSRFVTAKKTEALIKKLGTLCSDFDAKKLSRRVCLTERVKNANEIIYINIDSIHTAFDESRAGSTVTTARFTRLYPSRSYGITRIIISSLTTASQSRCVITALTRWLTLLRAVSLLPRR